MLTQQTTGSRTRPIDGPFSTPPRLQVETLADWCLQPIELMIQPQPATANVETR